VSHRIIESSRCKGCGAVLGLVEVDGEHACAGCDQIGRGVDGEGHFLMLQEGNEIAFRLYGHTVCWDAAFLRSSFSTTCPAA
jgi:hypothetical protein